MITFSLEEITPDTANQYLERNKGNRAITKDRVNALAREMRDGVFMVTHQCIAFNANGDLIDGQHRLSAIIQSGQNVKLFVARYERTETAMLLPFDNGLTRKHYDLLEYNKKQTELASAVLRLMSHGKIITTNDVKECMELYAHEFALVLDSTANSAKHRSSAGAKAAIALLCRTYPAFSVEIVSQYVRFVNFNLEGMWPSVAACVRALENVRASGGSAIQRTVATRVWYAFKPENKHLRLIRIMDEQQLIDEMRDAC